MVEVPSAQKKRVTRSRHSLFFYLPHHVLKILELILLMEHKQHADRAVLPGIGNNFGGMRGVGECR